MMELHHLRYFSVLAEELNYSVAAEKCYISRQAMRQTVRAIEEEYHLQLVDNHRNHLSLTPAGKVLADHAKRILASYQQMDTDLRSISISSRPVRIGVSISLMPFYAPELLLALSHLSSHFPRLSIDVIKDDADTLLDNLKEDLLDAVILVDLGCLNEGYDRTLLRSDRFGIMLSMDHPLAERQELLLSDLDGETIAIMSNPDVAFSPFVETLRARGIRASFRILPSAYEGFHAVRTEQLLGLDRIAWTEPPQNPVAMEVDLPIDDFAESLQTVFLTKTNPPRELRLIADCLAADVQKCKPADELL